ncbi:acyl dehydratase [Phyllobacterium sp. 21LDTY02-6]|jgi:3-hydroxybutyryl-CoA dehydratase|uniref:MaoC/PaaZ C-terminal domain-containing protein n=1 Tax=unclassified Phyllobacterium TaxID=2638441 RepID=UPI0020217758|nr:MULTISPECIES: MaoC/PaaZ C-terminal domain-containing protein [unclassified Phyllobacterium]MCO4318607.1 acyl dehydratase [Phyllobacterium sp. 21LDTY02-6]MCX8281121.1 MaoC/PaaZ C-terminal domain-containing protein [Phyllobacterium sp. 0TCS1.6C]MCX8294592.1 MaoC/PaaZ C-terminal domain-containing protein [Phyllobacterium sp. 0TCS1.6A]
MTTQSPLTVGATFSFRKTMTVAEQAMFTGISGNLGPLYVDARAAEKAGAMGMVSFELAVSALATTCLNRLGGPDRRIGSIELSFLAPVIIGQSVQASAEIAAIEGDDAICKVSCINSGTGEEIISGAARLVPFAARG